MLSTVVTRLEKLQNPNPGIHATPHHAVSMRIAEIITGSHLALVAKDLSEILQIVDMNVPLIKTADKTKLVFGLNVDHLVMVFVA